MKPQLINYIKAGFPGLFVVSYEEARVEGIMKEVEAAITKSVEKDKDGPAKLFTWSCASGLYDVVEEAKIKDTEEPIAVIEHFLSAQQYSIYLLRDFHLFVEDKNPVVWRKLKEALVHAKSNNKTIVILGCRLTLPPELEKEITVIEFALPDREQLQTVLTSLLDGNGKKLKDVEDLPGVLSAAAGLTTTEAENAFSLSIIEKGKITKEVVYREKCQIVKKNGLLEVVDTDITLKDIGGLDNLKGWLIERKDAFSDAAREYHLPVPKGSMFVGQPGTGKSLCAKATRAVLGVPLLRLDGAKLFGSLVGQTEGNWRTVHATAKAMAPCILWIDEVDGLFSGAGSSGQTDGGTTSRTIKSILQDMQENSDGIFYVFTANDIDNLPSPVLRRLDEVWNVELPNEEERKQIWEIQIAKHHRKPKEYDTAALAAATGGYSGAEIEKLMRLALYTAFADGHREVAQRDVDHHIKEFKPLSQTMKEDIEKRKKRLDGVAKLASKPADTKTEKTSRKLAGYPGV